MHVRRACVESWSCTEHIDGLEVLQMSMFVSGLVAID